MKYDAMLPNANCQKSDAVDLISSRAIVFWDFDGVIKDSVNVKTEAFVRLFSVYGPNIAARVKAHHETSGGVSRYEKIPIYLRWVGLPCDKNHVDEFCARFSDAIFEAIVDSPWVPGVKEYLLEHYEHQHFVLVTASPQKEIDSIIDKLGIAHCFRQVYGTPAEKKGVIAAVLREQRIEAADALMVGDSETDRSAADANQVLFLLRRTTINQSLQSNYCGPQFEDLL